MFRATLKSLLARKVRLVLSGLAVVLGVMFVAGSFVLTDSLGRTFDELFSGAYATTDVAVTAKPKVEISEFEGEETAAPLPAAAVEQIKTIAGVRSATALVEADGTRVIGSDGKVLPSTGPPRLGTAWTGEDDLVQLRAGRGPAADDEIAVNATVAEAAGIEVGDRVGVLTIEPKKEFTLVGIWGYAGGRDSLGGIQEVAFTVPVAQRLVLGEADAYSSVRVRAADGVTPEALRDRIGGALGAAYEVKTGKQLAEDNAADLKEGLGFFGQILLGFSGVALFVGIFLILNTFSIVVAQRTRELALMRALGASRGQMIGSVLLEAVIIGLLAAVLGLAAGYGVGVGLAYLFGQFAGGLDLVAPGLPLAAVVSSFTIGILVTVVAAVLPALRASRIPPIAAMQDVATPDRPLTRLSVAGGVITSAGAALLGTGLFADAGGTALWLILGGILVTFIGVALLTPLVSRPVVGLLGRLFAWSLPGRLGRLNSGRNPRRTAITAAALMVGIALVTGVTVVMESAKSSIRTEAARVVKAEIVISGDQSGPRPPTYDTKVLTEARELPGVQAAGGLWNDQATLDGKQEYIAASDDLAQLARTFGTGTSGLTTLRPDQMVVDRSTATERGWQPGTKVEVQTSRGDPATYTVAATFTDEDLPGSIFLPAGAIDGFAIPQPVMGLVRLDDGAAIGAVLPQVKALLADSPEVSATDVSTFVDQQAALIDTVITMIQILLALAILIAVLGVVNTLALSVLERTRELGLLRAVGLGRAQTMRMITVEAVVISVFGALLGVVVGSGMGLAAVRALENEGFTDTVLPWPRMGTYLLLAALVGVIAAVVPAIRAARLNVLGAIAHE